MIYSEQIIESLTSRLNHESFDAYEIYLANNDSLVVEARDGHVESFSRANTCGVAVRVLKNERIALSSSTDFSKAAIDCLVKNLSDYIKHVSPSAEAVIPQPQGEYTVLDEKQTRSLRKIPDFEKIAVALALEREAKAVDFRIKRVRQPLYEETIRQISIVNSFGIAQSFERGIALCEVRAVAQDKETCETGWDFSFSPCFEKLDYVAVAKRATQRALAMLGAKPLPSGSYDVVFDCRATANLLQLLTPSFFATNIQRKKSALIGKKGQLAYSPLVTIIDDGIMPDGYSTYLFDDEGLPRQKNFLVKKGQVVDWLYDAARAKRDNRKSTGNSFRASLHSPPTVDVTNCYLKKGELDLEVLYQAAQNGFLITDMMGLHTANVITGDFSLAVEGFAIAQGKIGRPVRGVIISGNVHDLFQRVEGVANNLKFQATFGAPAIFVPRVQVGGG
ncbi:MAG: TldD/PmbA family protein [Pseudomonadota bacterium]